MKHIVLKAEQIDWRQWLEKNHQSKQSVWLVYYTKKSFVPSLSWSEAVDEALCFGWIDSTKKRFTIFFGLCSFLANVILKATGQKSIKKKFSNSLTAKECQKRVTKALQLQNKLRS